MIAVVIYTAIALDGVFKLNSHVDINFLIPKSSYLKDFNLIFKENYVDYGTESGIYMGQLNYTKLMPNIISMSNELQMKSNLVQNYSSWIEPFTQFVNEFYGIGKFFI